MGALAFSGSVMPLAGASPVAATVAISNPVSNVDYNAQTWNSTIQGTAADGTATVTEVDVTLHDTTAGLYFNDATQTWSASLKTFPANGTSSWTYSLYASLLPIGHSFTMTASAILDAGSPVDSEPVTFTYQDSVLNFACNSNANLFNTGFNANTSGFLPDYSPDSYWTVTGPVLTSGAGKPSDSATWTSASVNNLIPARWYSTPYFNSQWISQQNLDNPFQVPQNSSGDWWYRLKFKLDASVNAATFQMPFDWSADNNIYEIYVNGVAQSTVTSGIPQSSISPYAFHGYSRPMHRTQHFTDLLSRVKTPSWCNSSQIMTTKVSTQRSVQVRFAPLASR